MLVGWEGFGEEIGNVTVAGDPLDVELALADAVAEPVVPHVDGLGLSDFDRVVGEAHGCRVVADDDRRVRLRVTKGGGDGTHVDGVAGDEVGGGVLTFGSAADDDAAREPTITT